MKGGPNTLKIWTPGVPYKLGGFGKGGPFLLVGGSNLTVGSRGLKSARSHQGN